MLQHVDAGADHVPGIELGRQAGRIDLRFRLPPGSRRHPLPPVAGVFASSIDGLLPGRVRAVDVALSLQQLTELEQRVKRVRVVKRRTIQVGGAEPVGVLLVLQQVHQAGERRGGPLGGCASR